MTRLFNIRLGHACNSSSSHSIVPLGALLAKRGVKTVGDEVDSTGEYGWDNFVLASADEKMCYLACILEGSGFDLGEIEEITGVKLTEYTSSFGGEKYTGVEEYVDHQSRFTVPRDRQFAEDLTKYLRQKSVVILGGNDNDGDPEIDGHFTWTRYTGSDTIARADTGEDGLKYWTLFSPRSGNKVRFSFQDGSALRVEGLPSAQGPLYASLPELVDLKITGYCPFSKDCPMCYMDSDSSGEHADYDDIVAYLTQLGQAGTFEIAMGGGEPTLHPQFIDILKAGKDLGMAMNFTTKNFSWFLKRNQRLKDICRNASAVAFSVNSRKDLEQFQKVAESAREEGWRGVRSPWSDPEDVDERLEITMQTIPALHSTSFVKELLLYASQEGLRVTLLGFKRVGRAKADQVVNPNHRWIDALVELVKEEKIRNWDLRSLIAIDTLMAEECKPAFDKAGISPVWYFTEEGTFSAYVDATTHRIGASSYIPENQMQGFAPQDDLGEAFRSMQKAAGIR